jgi:small conductance mechanosensitive channel
LIAAIGAAAFGTTVAIQGPLANFGAGLSIILTRPFKVGDTIAVKGANGVVEEITLAATILIGSNGERITVPNRQIVGEVISNSERYRTVDTRLRISYAENAERAIKLLLQALTSLPDIAKDPAPQVGILEFGDTGFTLELRYWVPNRHFFETRYTVNMDVLRVLAEAGIKLVPASANSPTDQRTTNEL